MKYYLALLSAIFLSLIIFSYSFKLALTGDDYLTLWRTIEYFKQPNSNLLKYLLTDYGPQDIITYLIYQIANLNGRIYYITAFILRVIASASIIPLVYFVTKSKWASIISASIFLVSFAGIETNNWSFNMPSFVSLAFINLHILFLFIYVKESKKKYFLVSLLLLVLAILSQPIRATFVPIFSIFSLFVLTLNSDKYSFKNFLFDGLLVALTLYLVILLTKIGMQFGVAEGFYQRLTLHWFGGQEEFFIRDFINTLLRGDFEIFLTPISQFGQLIIPLKILPQKYETLNSFSELLFLTLATYLVSSLIALYRNGKGREKTHIDILTLFWTLVCMANLLLNYILPIHSFMYLGQLVGGFFFIHLWFIFNKEKLSLSNKYLVIMIAFTFLTFLAPWIRGPKDLQPADSRYLIFTASGFAVLVGIVYSKLKGNILTMGAIIVIIATNFYVSLSYFRFLAVVREQDFVYKIRTSVPVNEKVVNNERVMYYINGDNPDVVYNTLGFGLPVILYFNQTVINPWNIAVTENFSDVVTAVKDGSSLKRFNITPVTPLPIDNVFSLEIRNGTLIDNTEEIRERLIGYN